MTVFGLLDCWIVRIFLSFLPVTSYLSSKTRGPIVVVAVFVSCFVLCCLVCLVSMFDVRCSDEIVDMGVV